MTRDRRRVGVVLVACLFGATVLGAAAGHPAPTSGPAAENSAVDTHIETVAPVENGSELWPYTSAARSFDRRTLGINLLVRGDPDRVRRVFRRVTDRRDWERSATGVESTDPSPDDPVIGWKGAHGSTRYTYVTAGANGSWIAESYQLYDGSYLGARTHVRAYEAPDGGNWTAMQAHVEYWDWFRLRHTVTSVADARRTIEQPFLASGTEVSRVYLDNAGPADGDGWATVIELAGLALLIAGANGLRRLRRWVRGQRDAVALAAFVPALYVGVRVAAVGLEQAFPGVSPKLIAGPLYPVLAIGLPLAVARLAHPLSATDAFVAAAAGLAAAFLLEFGYLSVHLVPIGQLLHRTALVLAVGLIAYGSASGPESGRVRAYGALAWVVSLAVPLVGLL